MWWIIILSILLITSIYINYNLFRQLETLERSNEDLVNWFDGFEVRILEILNNIKDIDQRGSFESDDEVGTTFKLIKETISRLEEFRSKQ